MRTDKYNHAMLIVAIFSLLIFAGTANADVITEKDHLIIENAGLSATSSFVTGGMQLILPARNHPASSSVRLSVLDEPIVELAKAKPISKIYQIDFSQATTENYILNLKFETANNFNKTIYYFDGVSKTWKPLPTRENFLEKTVSTELGFSFVRVAVFENTSVLSVGKASWYAYKGGLFAASPDYVAGTKLQVTSVSNPEKSIVVTVNDYGPDRKVHPDRVIDLDKVAFAQLAPVGAGVISVFVQPVSAGVPSVSATAPAEVKQIPAKEVPVTSKKEDLSKQAVASQVGDLGYGQGELWQNTTTGGVYWVTAAGKHPLTDRVFLQTLFKGKKINRKTPAQLAGLKTLSPIRFHDGYLLRTANNPAVYLLHGNMARPFASGDLFEELGYGWSEVTIIPSAVLKQYQTGALITTANVIRPDIAISSRSAVVLDSASGQVLYSKNANEQLPLASLTKLVAMKVFLDTKPNLNQVVTYKVQDENYNYAYADKSVLARLRVSDGETMTIRDLLYSSVLGSANNAVESLVRVSGLKRADFIAKMNKYAKNVGATQTKFVEPTGLSPENVSTAKDYGLLTRAVLTDGHLEKVSMTKKYNFVTINKKIPHYLKNSNSLFFNTNLQITGSKTGYLDEAQYCLMTRVKNNNGREVIAITFGTPTKNASFNETKNLINYGFARLN